MNPVSTEISESRIAEPARGVSPAKQQEPTTLVDLFELIARRSNRADTLNYKRDGSWVSISSADMIARARRIAAGLYSLGVRRGDRVALLSESRPEWTLTDAGCLLVGAVDVPIYPTLTAPQVHYILKDSGSRVLVLATESKYRELTEILKASPEVEQLVFFESPEKNNSGITLAELEERGRQLEQAQPGLIDQLARQVTPEDLATLIYTSGTTGEPKGVMLTHSNLATNLVDSSQQLSFAGGDVALSVLPLSHVFERQAMYMYLYRGMAVYYAESIDKIGANLREVSPTILVGVPRIFEKIYARIRERAAAEGKLNVVLLSWAVDLAKKYARHVIQRRKPSWWVRLQHALALRLVFSRWKRAFGGRIRLLVSGGAALPEDLGLLYLGAGIPIIQGYGLTETSPVIT
ncbi:MAG TPA: AMP-binding protein [Pyrinomonadaceae bacterium]|nr:AMP-binding protein [Pyrinomonadaceae bacterium]